MSPPKQLGECRTEPLLRSPTQRIDALLEQLDLEARHEPLRQLAYAASSVRQLLPFVGSEESELSGDVRWSIQTTIVEMRDRRRPRIDVRG